MSEDSLLLHDDLFRLADHVPLPSGMGAVSSEDDYGLPMLDGKSPAELSDIIGRECGVKSTTYASLIEYRLNALRRLWISLQFRERERRERKTNGGGTHSVAKNSHKGEGFASRVSLLLVFPMLHSLSKIDPNLSEVTAQILMESLKNCGPLSLSKEPNDCIIGLENLLCSWLVSAKEATPISDRQLQVAASALVALSVAV